MPHLIVVGVIALAVFVLEFMALRAGIDGKCLMAAIAALTGLAGYVVRLLVEYRKRLRSEHVEVKNRC